jgi:chromosome segregation ATPase
VGDFPSDDALIHRELYEALRAEVERMRTEWNKAHEEVLAVDKRLKAEVERRTKERDEARACVDKEREDVLTLLNKVAENGQERDAALARAEKAEAEAERLHTECAELIIRATTAEREYEAVSEKRRTLWAEVDRLTKERDAARQQVCTDPCCKASAVFRDEEVKP